MSQFLLRVADASTPQAEFHSFARHLESWQKANATIHTPGSSTHVATAAMPEGKQPLSIWRSNDGQITLFALGTWLPVPARPGTSGQWLLETYRQSGVLALARQVQGLFALLIVDADTGMTHVITDRCGSYHLFYRRTAEATFVSTSSTVLAMCDKLSPLDAQGVHEFVATGVVYEDRTVWAQVKKLQGASILSIAPNAQTSIQKYWHFTDLPVESLGLAEAADQTQQGLIGILKALPESDLPMVSDLTGGYDSRLLLSALLASGRSFTTTVSGQNDNPDVIVARNIADTFSLSHKQILPLQHLPVDLLDSALRMCDGEFDIFECANILHTHRSNTPSHNLSLNGSFGELARGYWWELLWPRLAKTENLDAHMLARRRFAATPYEARIFAQPAALNLVQHMSEVISRNLQEVRGLPNTSQMDFIYYTLRMQRWQGRIASSTNRLWPAFSPVSFNDALNPILSAKAKTRFRSLLARKIIASNPRLSLIPLEHGYPPCPAHLGNLWRFTPVLSHYGGLVIERLAGKFKPAAQGEGPPMQRERHEFSALFEHAGLAEKLAAPRLLESGIFSEAFLPEFLSPSNRLNETRNRQWRRLVSLELMLREVSG